MPHRYQLPRKALFLLASLALGWGFNWPIMKVVVGAVPPLTFRGICLTAGGLGVLGLARLNGLSLDMPRKYWRQMFWLVVFNMIGWNVCATYGVSLLPSGRAALLGYTMPLWCVPLSVWLLREPLNLRRILALVLGLAGVLVLMSENLADMGHAPIGVMLMIIAAWSWATGMVLLKYWQVPMNTVTLTGWMMFCGGVPLLIAAYLVDGLPTHVPGFWPLFGLVYNIIIGFMFCYWAWNKLVLLVPVSVSSLSSLITPLVGVGAGALFLGEQPGWREALSAALILGAVAVISWGPRSAEN